MAWATNNEQRCPARCSSIKLSLKLRKTGRETCESTTRLIKRNQCCKMQKMQSNRGSSWRVVSVWTKEMYARSKLFRRRKKKTGKRIARYQREKQKIMGLVASREGGGRGTRMYMLGEEMAGS